MNEWFRRKGIRQSDVAKALGVSISTVSRMFAGVVPLSMERASSLHRLYGVPFGVMCSTAESEKSQEDS